MAPTIVDHPTDDGGLAEFEQTTLPVRMFFNQSLTTYRSQAIELQRRAVEDLQLAQQWVKPTTLEEDQALVARKKDNDREIELVEEHSSISKKIHALLRAITGPREATLSVRKQISQIATSLHQQYEADEKRKIDEARERERRRLLAEAEERKRQELAALEAEAARAELESPILSVREQRFVDCVTTGGFTDIEAAAVRAGFKSKGAGAELMSREKVRLAIEAFHVAANIRRQAEVRNREQVHVAMGKAPKVAKAATTVDTYSAEVINEALLVAAIVDPVQRERYGLTLDMLTVKQAPLTALAKDKKEALNLIPGLRAVKSSTLR